jgi:lipopolysaccharide export system protein LptC
MQGRSTILFPLIVLAILAFISFWIESTVKSPLHRSKASLRHDPDYYLENFVTTKTDIKGNLRSMLAATAMQHYPDNDSTYLTRPRFTQFANNLPYTQIEGQKGQISSNGEEVEFTKNVVVFRRALAGKPEMRLATDYLKIHAKQEIATTNSPVLITQGTKTVIRGTGMIYDKKQQSFTLLKKVKVHYEKPARLTSSEKEVSSKNKLKSDHQKLPKQQKLSNETQPDTQAKKRSKRSNHA